MYLHIAVLRRKLAADSGKKIRFMLAQWPKFTWQSVLLRWAIISLGQIAHKKNSGHSPATGFFL
jgi:hypothetical protein